MWHLRRRCILVAWAVAALFPAIATAEDAAWQDDLKSIDAKLFFVRKLNEQYRVSRVAETWGLLEADARDFVQKYPAVPDFGRVHRDVLLGWAGTLERLEQQTEALKRYAAIVSQYEIDASGVRDAAQRSAAIHVRIAEDAAGDEEKLASFRAARNLYTKIGDTRSATGLSSRIIDLQCKEGIRLYALKDYAGAYDALAPVRDAAGGDLGEGDAAKALRDIEEKTGVLSVDFLEIAVKGTDAKEGSTLRLSPVGAGEALEAPAGDSVRWLTGTYEVELWLPGQDAAAVSARVTLGNSGATVEFPSRFPDGMIYVPAGSVYVKPGMKFTGTADEVKRPYFIDRTEVSIEAYRAFDPKYKPYHKVGGNYPAHGITFERAQAYAAHVGKKLPTWAQWRRAGFGEGKQRYPWGDTIRDGYANLGTKRPTPVDSFATGGGAFGALNMAGNVWEWLRSGYAIGGSFGMGRLEYDLGGWKIDFLMDPKPGIRTYGSMKGKLSRDYSKYKAYESNLQEVGIRCVIEL